MSFYDPQKQGKVARWILATGSMIRFSRPTRFFDVCVCACPVCVCVSVGSVWFSDEVCVFLSCPVFPAV